MNGLSPIKNIKAARMRLAAIVICMLFIIKINHIPFEISFIIFVKISSPYIVTIPLISIHIVSTHFSHLNICTSVRQWRFYILFLLDRYCKQNKRNIRILHKVLGHDIRFRPIFRIQSSSHQFPVLWWVYTHLKSFFHTLFYRIS